MKKEKSISSNIFQTFVVQIPNYILGIAAGIFITRQLGPEGKGVYAFFIANMQLLVMFFGFNITGGLKYFVANKKMAGVIFGFRSGFYLLFHCLLTLCFI